MYYVRRHERKFEVGVASAAFLREEIRRRLPLFEFVEGYPHTYVTTIYFDTKDRKLFRRAERHYDDNLKIRVKEYTYRDRDGGYMSFPHCFIELKQRSDGTVYKKRLRLPKKDLNGFLAGEDLWDDLVRTATDVAGPQDLRDAYEELRGYLTRFKVAATSIVNYRRTVFQTSEDELRITFDDEIAVYPAYRGLYARAKALTGDVLGRPKHRHDGIILEIKCPREQYPEWLQDALQNHFSKQLSKFTTSVRFLTKKPPAQTSPSAPAAPPSADHADAPQDGGSSSMDDTQLMTKPIEK